MLKLFKKDKEINEEIQLDFNKIPKHIAIIMDGNGRWAKKRKLPRSMGHKAGVETIRKILKEADRLGVEYMTLYAFSTENWKRPKDEVEALMKLLVQYLTNEVEALHQNGVVLRILGDVDALPDQVKNKIYEAIELTKDNKGIVLNVAFNYGGRDEIVRAVKNIASDIESGKINKENIDEDLFNNYLYTKNSPDPDLIIRPSGEQRISNFLLWQCAYSEFWYSNVNWPDFSESDLQKAIYDYQNRDRRFGGV
ncbi:isoprenyl transferase [Clostridium sp. NSJ-49]|uniref:Isoprenyl transferase n=1 Tax=Clostridium disporicum TaxID=84024 RepID=A0A173Z1X9_9CLOT|nr:MULTISPECIES: isoprenyl transferase [Clostridium]MBC5623936.1 isoprenyl transferase [Clostridium sp. NSJ-49]MCD2502616.1 isoprenyl transferase [Clostridium sp. NSJ-145]MDU6340657.1 isoprenyl transferase [Clostridium sp.]CUN69699.1 di-trans%2Cpoly-cis-decaprenylcistransferase [Clostridium disporicum]